MEIFNSVDRKFCTCSKLNWSEQLKRATNTAPQMRDTRLELICRSSREHKQFVLWSISTVYNVEDLHIEDPLRRAPTFDGQHSHKSVRTMRALAHVLLRLIRPPRPFIAAFKKEVSGSFACSLLVITTWHNSLTDTISTSNPILWLSIQLMPIVWFHLYLL